MTQLKSFFRNCVRSSSIIYSFSIPNILARSGEFLTPIISTYVSKTSTESTSLEPTVDVFCLYSLSLHNDDSVGGVFLLKQFAQGTFFLHLLISFREKFSPFPLIVHCKKFHVFFFVYQSVTRRIHEDSSLSCAELIVLELPFFFGRRLFLEEFRRYANVASPSRIFSTWRALFADCHDKCLHCERISNVNRASKDSTWRDMPFDGISTPNFTCLRLIPVLLSPLTATFDAIIFPAGTWNYSNLKQTPTRMSCNSRSLLVIAVS